MNVSRIENILMLVALVIVVFSIAFAYSNHYSEERVYKQCAYYADGFVDAVNLIVEGSGKASSPDIFDSFLTLGGSSHVETLSGRLLSSTGGDGNDKIIALSRWVRDKQYGEIPKTLQIQYIEEKEYPPPLDQYYYQLYFSCLLQALSKL